jgi:predicted secreted hydrolase
LTFFRSALTPEMPARASTLASNQVYMAHFALTDGGRGAHASFDRYSRGAGELAGAVGEPAYRVWLEDWAAAEIRAGRAAADARAEGEDGPVAIDLTLRETRAPVLHGIDGLHQKGPEAGNASYYYSLVGLETTGTVTSAGRSVEVTGQSWMDHEFGTSALTAGAVGWDWFSVQFDNGAILMLYEIRLADGGVNPNIKGTLIWPDGVQQMVSENDFDLTPTGTWTSPRTNITYPSGWTLTLPDLGIDLAITPLLADQEMDVSFVYWEGALILPRLAQAAPFVQTAPAPVTLPAIVPQQPTEVALHTHLVRIELAPDAQSTLVTLAAEYRLRNDNRTAASVPVQWDAPVPANVAVTLNNAPLATVSEGQRTTAQIDVPADSELTLQLRYQQTLPAAAIQSIRYPTRSLDPWGGQPSLRVDLLPGDALPPEAWLSVTPPSWRYAPPTVTAGTALEWLYDGGLPDAITFEFVAPPVWQETQQLASTATTPATYAALGAAYQRLASAAAALGDSPLQERFYAQAVAAYTAGIRVAEGAGAPIIETATLHADLAALYRTQVVGADGVANPIFAELMTLETDRALPGIMADDPRRAELLRWQGEGCACSWLMRGVGATLPPRWR